MNRSAILALSFLPFVFAADTGAGTGGAATGDTATRNRRTDEQVKESLSVIPANKDEARALSRQLMKDREVFETRMDSAKAAFDKAKASVIEFDGAFDKTVLVIGGADPKEVYAAELKAKADAEAAAAKAAAEAAKGPAGSPATA